MTGRSPSTAGPSLSSISSSGRAIPAGITCPRPLRRSGWRTACLSASRSSGRQYDDLTCLHMAGLIEEGYYRFTPPPGY